MGNLQNYERHKVVVCPKCGAEIEAVEGYTQWCEKCLWNLKPHEQKDSKDTITYKIYKRIGRKAGKKLLEEMLKSKYIKPRLTLTKLTAFLISCLVFSVSILSIVAMVYLLKYSGINIVSIIISLLLMGISISALPRFDKVPKNILSRRDFPNIYRLVDSITKAVNTEEVYGIVINEEFNAAYTEVGIKRRKIIYIGLPLFSILNDEEKIALLSHEIAHGLNGDVTRGLVTGAAIKTLIAWYDMFSPIDDIDSVRENIYIISLISKLIMFIFSKIILVFITILTYLIYNDSQKAEYLADYIGTSISGTDAMKSLLDKLHFGNTYITALRKAALSKGEISFFHELKAQVESIPQKEIARIKLVKRMEDSQLDATHPPTPYRIAFMERQGGLNPKIVLTKDDSLLIDEEVSKLKENIERKFIDDYKAWIYS